jgi:threonine dehydratase
LKKIVTKTPLQRSTHLSKKYDCNVFLKREDLQVVRSYKLRGAYNMMSSLPKEQLDRGVVCASAGNHAQGFAFSCKKLNAKGVVFMPTITPNQKVKQTQMHGDGNVEIKLVGDTFDDCAIYRKKIYGGQWHGLHSSFDDHRIIEGQGTVGVEILEDPELCRLFISPDRWWWIVCRCWFLFQNLFSKNKDHRIGT